MKPASAKLYGFVGLMTLIWSLSYVVAKVLVRSIPPLLAGPLRAAAAALLLLPVYLILRRRGAAGEHWSARELLTLGLLGVFGITLNQLFFVLGMLRTSVAHAALVIASTPVQVILLAALRGQERVTIRKIAGMLVAIAGVAALQFGPGKAAHGATFAGDAIIFAGSLSFAVYTVFGKEVARRHDSLTVNTFGYLAGALAGAPLLLWESRGFVFSRVTPLAWGALAYMAVLSSIVCYLIFNYALGHMSASRLAAFSYAQPVIAAFAGSLLLGEQVTMAVASGGLLVLSGVWLTARG